MIGIQYGISGLIFLFFGFCLMMLMRWQLAYPGQALPVIGNLIERMLGPGSMTNGVMTPEFYNSLGAMHGTIMIFLGIVPLAFAAFGNFVVPLQIGAPDMTFPKINMASYQAFFVGGIIMLVSFFVPAERPRAAGLPTRRWPISRTRADLQCHLQRPDPLADRLHPADHFVIVRRSEFHRDDHSAPRQGDDLDAAAVFRLGAVCHRVSAPARFPAARIGDCDATDGSRGGDELLFAERSGGEWRGGFRQRRRQSAAVAASVWFLGHPEVYVLILPGMGIVAEIIANNTRKPLWGYKSLVFAALVLGFLSFIVWAHHMWLTGMGSVVSAFFQTTTMIISIPSVIILSAFFISLWGGSIRFNVPMLFATAFLPMFGIGGLTGIPLAFNSADLYLHDTYYVIAHFHYIVAPGTIFAVFAGIYFWFPKATGRMMNEFWGKVHFWPSLICMNIIFLPMFLQGMLGMHRRWYDGGQNWQLAGEKVWGLSGFEWNTPISIAAWVMGLAQIPFIINFFWSMKRGEK